MRGSIVRRGNGYSVVELDRDPITNRRRQKWHGGFTTKRAAERALAKIVSEVDAGTYVERTRATVAEFAAEWLAAIEPTVRPATHYSYARNVRLHVLPYIGSMPLASVDAGTLNGLYARLLVDRRKDQAIGSGLSARSVSYVHTIVHRMFKDAVRWGRLARNPADVADPPSQATGTRTAFDTWTAEQLRAFLSGTSLDRLWAAFVVLATAGMRRGEALGLRWIDLDLDRGQAAVRQTVITVQHEVRIGDPKTAKGRRTVDLDPATVAAPREHRKRQAAERLLMGSGWTAHGLVFCRVEGGPLHPERF